MTNFFFTIVPLNSIYIIQVYSNLFIPSLCYNLLTLQNEPFVSAMTSISEVNFLPVSHFSDLESRKSHRGRGLNLVNMMYSFRGTIRGVFWLQLKKWELVLCHNGKCVFHVFIGIRFWMAISKQTHHPSCWKLSMCTCSHSTLNTSH